MHDFYKFFNSGVLKSGKNRACDWDLLAIYSNLKQEMGGDNPLCPPFRCGLCPFATLTPDSLKQHMMTHVVERPYRCPICGKGFTQKGSVQLHMLHHTGERPHKCPVCQRSYSQKGSMRRHILQHLPPDCQRCPLCSASRFPLRADLETHLIQHTKKDSCRCDRCNATFTSDTLLAEHTRLHHSATDDTATSA